MTNDQNRTVEVICQENGGIERKEKNNAFRIGSHETKYIEYDDTNE